MEKYCITEEAVSSIKFNLVIIKLVMYLGGVYLLFTINVLFCFILKSWQEALTCPVRSIQWGKTRTSVEY